MSIFEEKYTSAEFADLIGVTTENLRDWRRRGIDIGLGVAVNGRKRYSDYDRFEMEVVRTLRDDAIDHYAESTEIARHIAPYILENLGSDVSEHPQKAWSDLFNGGGRYLVVNGLRMIRMGDDVAELIDRMDTGHHASVFRVVDCRHLTARLAPWVATELNANTA